MNELIYLLLMINFVASLVVFLLILQNNNYNFIIWIKNSFRVRNWFGKLQICLAIIWMTPIILVNLLVYPIAWIIAKIFIVVFLICSKIVELGKK